MTDKKFPEDQQKAMNADVKQDKLETDNSVDEAQLLDDDWLSMTSDWQSQPYEKVDITALVKQTKRRIIWAKILLACDVIAVLFLYALLAYVLLEDNEKAATIAYVVAGCVIYTVYLYHAIKLRIGSWRIMSSDPNNIIDSAIVGYKSSIQYNRLIKWATILLWPTVNIYLYVIAPLTEKSLFWPAVIGNLVLIGTILTVHWFQRKREQELKQMQEIKSE